MANRSMAAKIAKAKKCAIQESLESANNFGCTKYFEATSRSRYGKDFWLKRQPYTKREAVSAR